MVFDKHSRRVARFVLPLAGTLLLSACITIPVGPAQESTPAPEKSPQSYVDRLKATPVAQETEGFGGGELAQFVTDSRNIACVFTTSKGGNVNQPWEPNNYADAEQAAAPTIPVVNCEMVRYPDVLAADRKDDCSGTHVGFLGGTVVLYPEDVVYGNCRAGITAVEAAYGPGGTVGQAMAEIPVLTQGQAMESQGYRCAPMDDGVACANLASGLGFFVAADHYEIFGRA